MFLNGVSVALDEGHLCEPTISGLAGRLLTASRKAERLGGLVCLDRRQGGTAVEEIAQNEENPIKSAFPILHLETLGV